MIVGLRGAVLSQVQVEAQTWKRVGLTYTWIGQVIPPGIPPGSNLPVCQARRYACWPASTPSHCLQTPLLHSTYRRALPTREIHHTQNCWRTNHPPQNTRRRQTRHHCAYLHTANDTNTTLSPAATPQQRPTRRGRAARHYANERPSPFLERVHQGYALA
jgi:hypothetical protein